MLPGGRSGIGRSSSDTRLPARGRIAPVRSIGGSVTDRVVGASFEWMVSSERTDYEAVALDLGADDCVTPPVCVRTVVARTRAVL
jgi:hypothetical protein